MKQARAFKVSICGKIMVKAKTVRHFMLSRHKGKTSVSKRISQLVNTATWHNINFITMSMLKIKQIKLNKLKEK